MINQLNKNTQKYLVLAQDDKVCFQIVEESITKDLPNRSDLSSWEKLNKKIQQARGGSKTRIHKKFAKSELDDDTRY